MNLLLLHPPSPQSAIEHEPTQLALSNELSFKERSLLMQYINSTLTMVTVKLFVLDFGPLSPDLFL